MIYKDRGNAGRQLAEALKEYANDPEAIVIALPRGGVVVGAEVAKALHLPLDIVSPRKIGAPFNEEYAIGAVTETGESIISQELVRELGISQDDLKKSVEEEAQKAKWRLDHYRKNRPPRNLKGKRVIIIDDGLATGSTMRAALKTVRAEEAKEIVIAVPVAPPDTLAKLEREADKTLCLSTPPSFFSVGQFYDSFDQTTDEEVISLLD
ncbi:MAG: phosphoribosyltransferase [Chlamydiales bacterium]|nr:phosphoribosyltransferase [Chlamydiales bacterium]